MVMVLVLCTLVLFLRLTASHYIMCHTGHKWDMEKKMCMFCDNDTYMHEDEHFHTECFPCAKVRNKNTEYVIRECSFEENALIGSYRQTDKNSCLSDKFFMDVNSVGVKVCQVRMMPCKQGQFFVSGDKCSPCAPDTYMVDDDHNNMACNPCQQLPHNLEVDSYVATACHITRNSTSMTDGLPVDTASFNSSHLPDVCKKYLGEKIHLVDMNKTDLMSTAPSGRNLYEVLHYLLIVITASFLLIILVIALTALVAAKSKFYVSCMKHLMGKQDAVQICLCTGIAVVVVCILVTLILLNKDSELGIFIIVIICLAVLFAYVVIIVGILYMLMYQHISQKTYLWM